MIQRRNTIIILCEGDSENAYIQELNRFLRDKEDYNFTFVTKVIGSGFYSIVLKKYNEVRRKNRNATIKIFLDKDIYVRNERACQTSLENSKIKGDFLFNVHNFEDFIMLHYDDETLNKWLDICKQHNHEKQPMIADDYLPQIINLISGYQKGECPFIIDQSYLDNLFAHNTDQNIFIKSDFVTFIQKLFSKN